MSSSHLDPASSMIFWSTLLLLLGLLGRHLAKLLNQSSVLGELLMGVLVGNLCYFAGLQLIFILRDSPTIFAIMQQLLTGMALPAAVSSVVSDQNHAAQFLAVLSQPEANDWIKISYVVDIFSRYGVIFLLFMVGLESSLTDLRKTGRESLLVAVIGVVTPILLGLLVLRIFMPTIGFHSALFVAATLSATSVGITARVLKDMKKLNTREAKTILGAAMLDDVFGLVILAIVSGLVMHDQISILAIGKIIISAILFFPIALWMGPRILRYLIAWVAFLEPWEAKLLVCYIFLMGYAWMATLVGMSSIIGAFTAGIILHDGLFESRERSIRNPRRIEHLLAPFEVVFAPLFFMLIGIQIKLETFLNWQVMVVAFGLIVVAIIGKLVCGWGGHKQDDRLLIGIGMVPRGEVGLIFASVGKTIGVIPDTLFSAIVMMVVVTTLITPMWMRRRFNAHGAQSS